LTSVGGSGSSGDINVERVNITLRAETRRRLNQARYKHAVQINVSALCDAAITAELDRLERPGAGPVTIDLSEHVARVQTIAAHLRGRMESVMEDSAQGRDLPLVANSVSLNEPRPHWLRAAAVMAMLVRGGRLVVIPPERGAQD
jgi:hypothetical protein